MPNLVTLPYQLLTFQYRLSTIVMMSLPDFLLEAYLPQRPYVNIGGLPGLSNDFPPCVEIWRNLEKYPLYQQLPFVSVQLCYMSRHYLYVYSTSGCQTFSL